MIILLFIFLSSAGEPVAFLWSIQIYAFFFEPQNHLAHLAHFSPAIGGTQLNIAPYYFTFIRENRG